MVRVGMGIVALVALAGPLAAPEKTPTAEEYAAVIKAVAGGLVKVECTLQFDNKGEPPDSDGYGAYGVVQEERPAEAGGFLIAPTTVLTLDPIIHPRFVKEIVVRFGDEQVKAKVAAYAAKQPALLLELEAPLKSGKPLAFQGERKGPYLTVHYHRFGLRALWTTSVRPLESGVTAEEDGRQFLDCPSPCLLVDAGGVPVGADMSGELPLDESWKGSPQKWPAVSADEMARLLGDLEARAGKGLLRVQLNFRSPRKGESPFVHFRSSEDAESATEMNVVGVLVQPARVLVLADLKPNVTARLERIQVHPAKGEPVPARFKHTLTDYGAIVAELEKPLEGALPFSERRLLDLRQVLLPSIQVKVHGEDWQMYFAHQRISSFQLGWKQRLYPRVSGEESIFVFDAQGALSVLPIARREKVSVQDRWGRGDRPVLTAAAYVKEVFADLAKNSDPSNVPLTEEEENRLAWLGVELQALNRDLARINKVSHLTNDGQTGAVVSYVYPDSPAAKAGVKPGYVLIRLHVPGDPKPMDIRLEEYGFGESPFPWDQLDQVPEQYFEHLPPPWPAPENAFTRALTDLGFGKKYAAEFFHDGQSRRLDFEVVQGPPHYDSAARLKSNDLGLTVRDLTYEVRRYFQLTERDPGVIVSKIEPGSKASVGGIKPYEIITHVNDQPVAGVKDFGKLTDKKDELRFQVKRMTKGRVVRIRMTGPPATAPAEVPPAAPAPELE